MQAVDAQAADLEGLAGLDRAIDLHQSLCLERVGQDLHAEPLLVGVVLRHMVVVVMGEEQVLDRQVVALDRLEQRL